MLPVKIILLFFLFCCNSYWACAQLEFVPPIQAIIKDSSKLHGVIILNTMDTHLHMVRENFVLFGTPYSYPSTLQVINPLKPYPPVFFTNIKPKGPEIDDTEFFFDFRYQPNSRLFSYYHGRQWNATEGAFFLIDGNFSLVDSFTGTHCNIDNHDFQINNKGEQLFMSSADVAVDISSFTGNPADASVLVTIQKIEIMNGMGKLVFSWNPLEHIPLSDTYRSYEGKKGKNTLTKGWDWCHGNSVRFALDGNILYSYRYLGVGKINRGTGKLMWKLGGKSPTITIPDCGDYYGQHDFYEITTGVYSLFSNGDKQHSTKAIIYKIDEEALTATVVKIYEPEFKVYSDGWGNYEIGNSGLSLFNYGRFTPEEKRETFFELADSNGTVASYTSPPFNFSYQVHQMNSWNPAQPSIKYDSGVFTVDNNAEAGWYLISESEAIHINYGSAFRPDKKGTYVATIRRGIGWLVSQPYHYE